jgi:hypothetical protein
VALPALIWAFQIHLVELLATVLFRMREFRTVWLTSNGYFSYYWANVAIAACLFAMALVVLVAASGLSQEVLRAISDLLAEKRDGAELRRGPRVPVLNDLIESEFTRLEGAGVTRQPPEPEVSQLSAILRETLAEVWGLELGLA